jgi:small subunit ribosomal protein S9
MAEEKKTTKKPAAPKKVVAKKADNSKAARREKKEKRTDGYVYAVGRRKRAVAQVKLYPEGKGKITVNGKDYKDYFGQIVLSEAVVSPLAAVGLEKVNIDAKVEGGGIRGQSEAVRLGISRALLLINAEWRSTLKKQGWLTRDPREKERKKPGLRKARRAPQWSKR